MNSGQQQHQQHSSQSALSALLGGGRQPHTPPSSGLSQFFGPQQQQGFSPFPASQQAPSSPTDLIALISRGIMRIPESFLGLMQSIPLIGVTFG